MLQLASMLLPAECCLHRTAQNLSAWATEAYVPVYYMTLPTAAFSAGGRRQLSSIAQLQVSNAVRTRSRAAGIVAVRLQASTTANRVGDTAMVIQPTVLGGSAIKAASIG
jgi:hypothetical protein